MRIRLDKFLANRGFGSRKEVDEIIKAGRVKVDDKVILLGKTKIDEEARVELDSDFIDNDFYVYYLLNKPEGYISASKDHRKTVIDLIKEEDRRPGLFPVGRLDMDSSGLLLISNDGRLAHELLSPKKHVPKEYYVELEKEIDKLAIKRFKEGIMLMPEGKLTLPAKLEILDANIAKVTIKEGKYHQVKRMFASCGNKVIKLKRLSMGPLKLGGLGICNYRKLTADEIEELKNYIAK